MTRILYMLAQVAWGFPQTLVGALVYARHAKQPHVRFHGAIVTTWDNPKGVSLGPFIFLRGPAAIRNPEVDEAIGSTPATNPETVLSSVDMGLLVHEYGHTVQSLILGPLYLLVIGAPSLIWSNLPSFVHKRQREQRSYYSFWVERSANWLGERVLKQPSIGQAIVD